MTADEQNTRFSAWITAHAAVLHHVANGFAAGADRADLFQELLLAVWRAVPRFSGGSQVSTYVYRVAHNTALTWSRTQRNYRHRVERFEAQAATAPGTPTVAPAVAAVDRTPEALTHIYAAIRALPPLDRSLVLLHLDGASYAEISLIHGLTETNVGARLTRLKKKLTAALAPITHELR